MLMLCLAQVGPTLVLLPATISLFWTGDDLWGTFLAICTFLWARWTISSGLY